MTSALRGYIIQSFSDNTQTVCLHTGFVTISSSKVTFDVAYASGVNSKSNYQKQQDDTWFYSKLSTRPIGAPTTRATCRPITQKEAMEIYKQLPNATIPCELFDRDNLYMCEFSDNVTKRIATIPHHGDSTHVSVTYLDATKQVIHQSSSELMDSNGTYKCDACNECV